MTRGGCHRRRSVLLVFAGLLCGSATTPVQPPPIPPQPAGLQSGDIIFIDGTSVRSLGVRLFGGSLNDYSHVGLIVMESGMAFIVHADPTRGGPSDEPGAVLKERWDVLMSPQRVRGGAVYRVVGMPAVARAIAADVAERYSRERRTFDHGFDRSNADELYCTELVWRAYGAADGSLDARAGDRLPKYLFPSDLFDFMSLQEVCRF